MFYQISLSPHLKQSVIISDKHDIYHLPPKLLKNLKLRILGKIRKISKLVLGIPIKMIFFSILAKNPWKMEIEIFLEGAILHDN